MESRPDFWKAVICQLCCGIEEIPDMAEHKWETRASVKKPALFEVLMDGERVGWVRQHLGLWRVTLESKGEYWRLEELDSLEAAAARVPELIAEREAYAAQHKEEP
jgi:hypothetical protein